MQHFIVRGATGIVTCEVNRSNMDTAVHDLFSGMSDDLIQLQIELGPSIQRTIRVIRSRSSAHDLAAHEFKLQGDGAQVLRAASGRRCVGARIRPRIRSIVRRAHSSIDTETPASSTGMDDLLDLAAHQLFDRLWIQWWQHQQRH